MHMAAHPLHVLLLHVGADRREEPRPVVRVVDLGDRAEAQPELRAHDRHCHHHRLHEVVTHRRLIGSAEHLAVGGGGRRVPAAADHGLHADGSGLPQSHVDRHARVSGDPEEMHHVLWRKLRLLERLLSGPSLRLVGGERALQPAMRGVDGHWPGQWANLASATLRRSPPRSFQGGNQAEHSKPVTTQAASGQRPDSFRILSACCAVTARWRFCTCAACGAFFGFRAGSSSSPSSSAPP